MSKIIKSDEAVLEDFRVDLYHVNDAEEPEKEPDSVGEEEYRKKYELISKEKKQILEHARIQAKQSASKLLEDAYAQRDKIVNTAETEAERLKEAARKEGYEEGIRESKQFVEERLEILNREIDSLNRAQKELFDEFNRDILDLAFNMTEKILKKTLEKDETALLELVKSVLREEAGKSDLTVHLSNRAYRMIEELEQQLEPIREQNGRNIKIKKDDIPSSDIKVETEEGIVDASISVQLENLKKFLDEYREDN